MKTVFIASVLILAASPCGGALAQTTITPSWQGGYDINVPPRIEGGQMIEGGTTQVRPNYQGGYNVYTPPTLDRQPVSPGPSIYVPPGPGNDLSGRF